MLQTPNFFILKFEVDVKNHNFVAIYFKESFDDHLPYVFKKHEIFLKTMKITFAGSGSAFRIDPDPGANQMLRIRDLLADFTPAGSGSAF
jgi:hypothetical protein